MLAEDGGFWLCRAAADVWLDQDTLQVNWMEQEEGGGVFRRQEWLDRIQLGSVLSRVALLREVGGALRLPEKEKARLEGLLARLKEGYTLQCYDKEHEQVRTVDVMVMEMEGVEEEEERAGEKRKASRGKSSKSTVPKKKAKLSKGNVKSKTKNHAKEKVPKAKKPVKPKVDKTNPNWRLKPNTTAPDWSEDPLFEGRQKLPFVSSLSHSKLAIRAVLTGDMKLLQQCVKNTEQIFSLHADRSLASSMTALRYAVKQQNLAMVKVLVKPQGKTASRVEAPRCLLATQGTGTYNYRSLGIKKIRKINMSRGSREGNNAFTKDQANGAMTNENPDLAADVISWNLPPKFLSELCLVLSGTSTIQLSEQELVAGVVQAVRQGHRQLAAHYIERDLARGGQAGFSKFHVQALLGEGDPWDGGVREASAKKKADWSNKQVTPLHCACINPDPGPLEALWKVCPDLHLCDSENMKPLHYAAVCSGVLPLQFLLGKGASLGEPDRQGLTPLLLASKAGREEVVSFIIEKQSKESDPEDLVTLKKFGVAGVDRAGKDSWTALHLAVSEGRHGVAGALVTIGARPDRQLNTTHDKMSSLMLAAAAGDLEMVKLLVEAGRAKVELGDRYKRTALTHACINGSSSVAAYLLRLGADPNRADSSGNSCLHYASAYGWWFCVAALLQAGALIQPRNVWGLTPLGVAVMKGHKGIAEHLATLPGVDIDVRDDKGRSLLLAMLVGQQQGGFSMSLLDEVKVLVERHGAQPGLVDYQGQSALHHLAATTFGQALKPWEKEDKEELVAFLAVTSYLLERGVSPWMADAEGDLPITLALATNSISKYGRRVPNMELIKLLLANMVDKVAQQSDERLETTMERLMTSFAANTNVIFSVQSLEIFHSLSTIMDVLRKGQQLSGMEFLDKVDDQSQTDLTLFAKLCKSYYNSSLSCQNHQGDKDELGSREWKDVVAECWDAGCALLKAWITSWSPTLHIDMPPGKKSWDRRIFLPLLDAARMRKDGQRAFKMFLALVPDVDAMGGKEETPLLEMIDQQEVELVKQLQERGAQVNRVRREEKEQVQNGKVKKVVLKEVPLQRAIRAGGLEMVGQLLETGASTQTLPTTGSSVLLLAVEEAARRKTKQSIGLVSLLLDHGSNIDESDSKGRTGLHLAVNASRGDSDCGQDLEALLLRRKAALAALDCRGRTALHYAFVKIGKHTDRTPCDPIQVVSNLVEGMSPALLDQTDKFGHTALHYAGLRGATVSALLLLEKGSRSLETRDQLGNTALSLAVLGKHDACAMTLLQRGANIDVTIAEGASKTGERCGLWRHLGHHWVEPVPPRAMSLFEGMVTNDWLGLTYLVLARMEQSDMTLASALEVAFRLNKLQFAKTMLGRFTDVAKLQTVVAEDRSLLCCLAFHTPPCTDQRTRELLTDVFQMILEQGVEPGQADRHSCLPLHYACLNRNIVLVELLLALPGSDAWLQARDGQGRTPLAAFCWNYNCQGGEGEAPILKLLLERGVWVNALFPSKPLSVLDGGFQPRHCSRGFLEPSLPEEVQVTLLMVAVTLGDLATTRLLLSQGASLTVEDSRGWSAAMYAFKAVNKEMVEELLPCLRQCKVSETDSLGLLHHVVALDPLSLHLGGATSHDDPGLLKEVLGLGRPSPSTVASLLQLAAKVGASRAAQLLAKRYSGKAAVVDVQPPAIEPPANHGKFEHKKDALEMMTALEKEVEEKQANVKVSKMTQSGCSVTEGHILEDFSILLSKIDVGLGSWGLYNFYRLQVWKDAHKELYVLFTNWGRIERHGRGQFQNTPYSNPEEAKAEFCKIFQAKTGNTWEERAQFVEKPRKYRIVAAELATKVLRPAVTLDLATGVSSHLSLPVQRLLKEAADPAMLAAAYSSGGDIDTGAVPFGRIRREVVVKAKDLLAQLVPLITKKEKLDTDKYRVEGEKQEAVLVQLGEVVADICRLSTEYFYLVPKPGAEFERLCPVDSSHSLTAEQQRLSLLLDFEAAKSLLLGAMLRRSKVSPV